MNMNGSGGGNDGFNAYNPVDKFEEAFMSCLSALTKEDTLTNVDRDEIRVDVEQGIFNVIESARTMEAYFLKKRLEISAQKPELLIKDDSNELRLELIRKDELLKKNYEKINHWQSILSDVQTASAGKQGGPGQGQHGVGHPPTGLSLQLSQAPHTPQGPMTPTGGPRTPGGAGRPQTPGGSGGVRMQTSTNIGYQQHPIGSPQIGQSSGLQGSRGRSGGRQGAKEKRDYGVNDEIHSESVTDQLLNPSEFEQGIYKNSSGEGKRKRGDRLLTPHKIQKRKEPTNMSSKRGCRKVGGCNHPEEMYTAMQQYNKLDDIKPIEDSSGETITVAVVVHKGPSGSRATIGHSSFL